MADSPDRRGSANGDPKKSGTGGTGDAEQQADAPAAAPDKEPRRPRLYGYDPDQWPKLN
ncbi:hypothetical protein [Arthrobacter sp. ZGTC412]|uniref:hypothetical protein n=1 Tax=Arthrobacter sp. ZGTC412 TaxID=2058900 RepID=UPI0015E2EB93|nr:hypothetical protein [Arthrobacter sp. ZGTC412]